VVGNIDFRLGWALVRSKRDIPRGIEKLQHASECIPDNTEILIKLSGVLYQECPQEDELRSALSLVKRVLEKERNNAEAHLLKGKIHLKLWENTAAIAPVEQAIKI
jgi:hypothetical protein